MDRTDLLLNKEVPIIIFDNFYDNEELRLIWEELELLTYPNKLFPPETTGTATENGETLKNNRGIFLDHVWGFKRDLSNILGVNRKIFSENMKIFRESPSWFYKFFVCERDSTLLSYYENNDFYKTHIDTSSITVLNWYFKAPKRFEGGDLILHYDDVQEKIELKNNRTVIFPSNIPHEITTIKMEEQYQNQKLGRYCLTQFLHVC